MATYFEPVLSEEQLAAYLDGMLSPEENNMVEDIIASDPEMEEILDTIDSVDSAYIYDTDEEIPIECLADDFYLPDTDGDGQHEVYSHHEENYDTHDFSEGGYDNTDDNYQDEPNDLDFQDDSSDMHNDDGIPSEDFGDLSF